MMHKSTLQVLELDQVHSVSGGDAASTFVHGATCAGSLLLIGASDGLLAGVGAGLVAGAACGEFLGDILGGGGSLGGTTAVFSSTSHQKL